jgi:hypothetical protein
MSKRWYKLKLAIFYTLLVIEILVLIKYIHYLVVVR